jgi:hypothetical protein
MDQPECPRVRAVRMSMNTRSRFGVPVAVVLSLGLTSCGSTYYLVKDPVNGAQYYTTAITKSGSAVEFKDSKTLTSMTLQNSQVSEITKDQYLAATGQH